MLPTRSAGVVLGILFSGVASAAALGSGGIDKNAPAAAPAPAKAAESASAPAPVTIPVVVAPPPIVPEGTYSLTYDTERDAGIAGHIVIGERSVWLWSLSGSWSEDTDRYGGSAAQRTKTDETNTRFSIGTGYRHLLGTGPTRTFIDSVFEIGYSDTTVESMSEVGTPTNTKSSQRDSHAAVSIKLGFEYFFNPSVSLEGAAGLKLTYINHGGRYADYQQNYIADRSGSEKNLDLFDAGLRVNYYW